MDILHCIGMLILFLFANKYNVNAAELFEELKEDRAFLAIWNAPSEHCDKYGTKFDLSKFTIAVNTNGTFKGNEMVIFYHKQLGLYPYLRDDGEPVNWGLPQVAAEHLDRHLKKVKSDVNRVIPDVNFKGLAVIDWEEWRPIFVRNGYNEKQERYITESKKLIRAKNPSKSEEWVESEAEAAFEKGSRVYMLKTLELCKKLRPKGFWGFYGFPDCYNCKPGQRTCTTDTIKLNNRLDWLFDSSTAILPSVYISYDGWSPEERFWNIHGQLQEALRLRARDTDPHKPVMVYTRFVYRDTKQYYDMEDLRSTIAQTADFGLNGVVLWESSASFNSKSACDAASQYVHQTLGPFVLEETLSMNNCSRNQCNMNGRCAKTEITPPAGHQGGSWLDRHPWLKSVFGFFIKSKPVTQMEISHSDSNEYVCICYEKWRGEHCEHRKPSPSKGTIMLSCYSGILTTLCILCSYLY